MADNITPELTKSWFTTLYGITEKGTPLTLVFLLGFGVFFAWVIMNHLNKTNARMDLLYTSYIESKDLQIIKAEDYANKIADMAIRCNISPSGVPP